MKIVEIGNIRETRAVINADGDCLHRGDAGRTRGAPVQPRVRGGAARPGERGGGKPLRKGGGAVTFPPEHPGPWSFDYNEEDPPVILDADGNAVVAVDSIYDPPDPDTARKIVDAMNGRDALIAERDELKRRLAAVAAALQKGGKA